MQPSLPSFASRCWGDGIESVHAAFPSRLATCRRVPLWLAAVVSLAVLPGCIDMMSDKDLQDCEVREQGARDPDLSACVRASAFMAADAPEACVPASAFSGEADCLLLDASAVLCDDGWPFDMEVFLDESHTSLDCNGQSIEHGEEGRPRSGIRAPYERSVSDVRVANCTIQYVQRYGVDLKRLFRGAELEGSMQGHERISITSSRIGHTGQIGVYVGQNSRDVLIEDVDIVDTYTGIYLEAGSKGAVVHRASILDSYERAGIHVDSSQENLIEHSRFQGNAGGAILLYKNCGERYGQVCPIRRRLGASHNTIRYNEFYGDGVSVADRQFKTYAMGWCAGIDVVGHWRDRSDDNAVYGNRFFHGSTLEIRDEPNLVFSNAFVDSVLEIGVRAPLGDKPIYFSGLIAGNTFTEGSWIGVLGKSVLAFHDVEVADNIDSEGKCYTEYRPREECIHRAGGRCYGDAHQIEDAVCSLPH